MIPRYISRLLDTSRIVVTNTHVLRTSYSFPLALFLILCRYWCCSALLLLIVAVTNCINYQLVLICLHPPKLYRLFLLSTSTLSLSIILLSPSWSVPTHICSWQLPMSYFPWNLHPRFSRRQQPELQNVRCSFGLHPNPREILQNCFSNQLRSIPFLFFAPINSHIVIIWLTIIYYNNIGWVAALASSSLRLDSRLLISGFDHSLVRSESLIDLLEMVDAWINPILLLPKGYMHLSVQSSMTPSNAYCRLTVLFRFLSI